jgi:CTP:molybdopterin cytidylyltransferase MocA
MTFVSGIVLAAGAGVRMGRPKADIELGGSRLIDRAVATLRAGGCDEVIAVVRAGTLVDGARPVVNPDPDRGMGSSLRLGLDAATGDRAVILLVDTPGVTAEAVSQLASGDAPVAIATYGGRRGHPVAFDRPLWPDVAASADGDSGARAFLRAHPDLVTEIACSGRLDDLDTPSDLDAWEQLE